MGPQPHPFCCSAHSACWCRCCRHWWHAVVLPQAGLNLAWPHPLPVWPRICLHTGTEHGQLCVFQFFLLALCFLFSSVEQPLLCMSSVLKDVSEWTGCPNYPGFYPHFSQSRPYSAQKMFFDMQFIRLQRLCSHGAVSREATVQIIGWHQALQRALHDLSGSCLMKVMADKFSLRGNSSFTMNVSVESALLTLHWPKAMQSNGATILCGVNTLWLLC